VPGESVSLVVMDRVPFAPPDDPVAARLREKAGERAFREVFLPKAQVVVRQGAGRLMRRSADREGRCGAARPEGGRQEVGQGDPEEPAARKEDRLDRGGGAVLRRGSQGG
jgi:RAD3-like DEAD/DEAH box helicase